MALVAFLSGAGFAIGLLVLLSAFAAQRSRDQARPVNRRVGIGIAGGSLFSLLTGWPVAGVLVGALFVAGPKLFGSRRAIESSIARTEAVAAWTETLRDTLAASAGLQRTIIVTARVTPEAIADEVTALAESLERRDPLPDALRVFADALADPTADLVVAALVLAYEKRAGNLNATLSALAISAREEASMQRRVRTRRASTGTSVSVITVTALATVAALVVFNRPFLEPYDSVAGQVVLGLVGSMFAAALYMLVRLSRFSPTERFLGSAAPDPSKSVAP